jgi:ArsR family transcriptional regulator, repressor of sdpIR and other operons
VPTDNKAFKALGDPTRRDILGLLRRGEMTAGDLAQRFDMTKPSMSHHFSVLKEADLITSRRDGQQIWYSLNTTVVQDLMAWAMDLIRGDQPKTRGDERMQQREVQPVENTPPEGDAK